MVFCGSHHPLGSSNIPLMVKQQLRWCAPLQDLVISSLELPRALLIT